MGYALFCFRKIQLTSEIDKIQNQVLKIQKKHQSIANVGGIFSDGAVSKEEWSDLSYTERVIGSNALKKISSGGGVTGSSGSGDSKSILISEKAQEYIEDQIAEEEDKLDQQQKRLETQLAAKQAELDAVVKGEETAIKNSTPKYA